MRPLPPACRLSLAALLALPLFVSAAEPASAPASNAAASPWTIDDIVNTEQITDITVSPTNPNDVVWSKSAADDDKNEYVTHLFRGGTGSKPTIQLTRGKDDCTHPRFSPDGKRLAFLSARPSPDDEGSGDDSDEPKTQIWLLEQGEPRRLTKLERDVQDFAWRDDNRILFIAAEAPSQRERGLKSAEDDSVVIEDEENEPPVRLFELQVESGTITRLTDNTDRITTLFVSPDGWFVVTIHNKSLRFEYDNQVRPETYLTDLRTGEQQRIFADRRFNITDVVWSFDSDSLYVTSAFTSNPKYLNTSVTELWRLDLGEKDVPEGERPGKDVIMGIRSRTRSIAGSKESQVLLDWPRGIASEAGWPSGGGTIAATDNGVLAVLADGARFRLARFTLNDGTWSREWVSVLVDNAAQFAAIHTASCLVKTASSADVRASVPFLYFLHSTGQSPPRLFSFGPANKPRQPFLIEASNPSFADKLKARTEIIRWKGARGDEIEGILHYPHDYRAGEKRPLVLMTHGGPFAADVDTWSDRAYLPVQLHAQRGAFVLRVNYHGSSQYGAEFADSIAGGPQYYDLPTEDIEKGVAHLVAQGLVDPARVAAMGWSNGAILTLALIIRQPDAYRVASSGAGGFEWTADTSITSFGQSFNDFYFGAMPSENPELYRKVAPFYQADRIRTPLIIFHGDADAAVPVHHGWMQFRTLQQRTKTPVKFLVFPGEDHGFAKLSHLRRKLREELAWFDQYLYGTAKPEEPWLKDGSPLAGALAARQAARVGTLFGVEVKRDARTNRRAAAKIERILVPETVVVNGLRVARFEVTRAQFAEFESGYAVPKVRENFPATEITAEQARGYVAWLTEVTGETWRLPTDAEAESLREIEAGDDAVENTLDRWAGYAPNPEDAAHLRARAETVLGADGLLCEVGSFSGRGDDPIFDLDGNAAEWVVGENDVLVLAGRSADQPAESATPTSQAAPAYRGFRVIRDATAAAASPP
jgi:dipeptidyl aminopeptidase/acylaminoacyl peptidase